MEGKVIFGKLLHSFPRTSLEASNFGPGKEIIILQKKQPTNKISIKMDKKREKSNSLE
jgi:hypothetical protein